MSAGSQQWDAALYDGRHAFVWKLGESLVALLAPQPGERILDLGCGTGHLTAAIAAAGATVIGLDHSDEMLGKARSAYPQLSFVQGDARSFAFAEPFDAVFSNAVLHWVREPETVIDCVKRGCAPVVVSSRSLAAGATSAPSSMLFGKRRHALARRCSNRRGTSRAWPNTPALLEAAGLEVRFAVLFDRPTPLEGPNGLRDWVAMFAAAVLENVPVARRDEFLKEVENAARPDLFRDGGWFADYRRLRVVAVRDLTFRHPPHGSGTSLNEKPSGIVTTSAGVSYSSVQSSGLIPPSLSRSVNW